MGQGFSWARKATSRASRRPVPWVGDGKATLDVGYTRNKTLIPGTAIPGVDATGFDRVFAGGDVRRNLGRYWTAYFGYQFNDLLLTGATCSGACSSQRHVALLGVEWHPRPIRLD